MHNKNVPPSEVPRLRPPRRIIETVGANKTLVSWCLQVLVAQVGEDLSLLRSKCAQLRGPKGVARMEAALAAARAAAAAEHAAAAAAADAEMAAADAALGQPPAVQVRSSGYCTDCLLAR